MNLLAIEAANGAPSVCLWQGSVPPLRWQGEPRSGPAPILAAARSLLATAGLECGELDAVACGRGPGAFTGVRLGIALAQGLALGIGCPVAPVSELAALAWRAHRVHEWRRVLACMDARKGEVYWAAFACDDGVPRAVGDEALSAPDRLVAPAGEWACAGSGTALLAGRGWAAGDAELVPDAEAIAALAAGMVADGAAVPPDRVEPAYLRNRVAVPRN